jgi:NTE family protein
MVYELLPPTGLSVFNTYPLFKTLTTILNKLPNKPSIRSLIGATNMYSGNLDIYNFNEYNKEEQVLLLMASSAIPGLFPPVKFNDQLYADGGTLSNELLETEHNSFYLNISFITPYEGYIYNDEPILCLQDMLKRTFSIVETNYNNPLATLNQNCRTQIGEINKYFVSSEHLKGYNILNFDRGAELINIGYEYIQRKQYKIC